MPDNVRDLRGRLSHSKPVPDIKKRFVASVPNPPTTLSPEAKAEWKRITPELGRTNVLSMVDRGLLTTYCETWASVRKLETIKRQMVKAMTKLDDPLEVLEAGELIAKVEGAINAKVRLMLPMMQQLLLTPVSRLRTPPPKKETDASEEDLD